MSQMSKHYEPEFKKKIVRLHLEEGRTLKGLAAEYGVSKASISIWVKQFREECQTNEEAKAVEGRTIYGRNRVCVGKVRRVSYRQCAVCGWHSCYIVDWGEGTSRKMTKPCTCGVKENPDGTLQII